VLAHIAEGRFAFGVGIGGTEDHQYEIAGVPINERGARCNESISFLREAARGEQFDFEGRFTRVEGARFLPTAPFAILVGGSSLAAQRRAARLGDGYMPFHVSLDRIREARDEVERQGAAARPGFEYVAHVYIAMNASRERALDHARENMARRYGEQVRETVERFAVVGTPETCRTYLADLAALGVTEALLAPVGTPETMPGEIQSLARELLK
jgi:alkanesulfonate monooxygenase SsuD/methylene tetrahydromethanopterin reductase-like flavin-dependent oxidoreductase (luciferase family)